MLVCLKKEGKKNHEHEVTLLLFHLQIIDIHKKQKYNEPSLKFWHERIMNSHQNRLKRENTLQLENHILALKMDKNLLKELPNADVERHSKQIETVLQDADKHND